jgi:ankyrin repeat protein
MDSDQANPFMSLTRRSFTTGWHIDDHDLHPADAESLAQNSLHLTVELARNPLSLGDGDMSFPVLSIRQQSTQYGMTHIGVEHPESCLLFDDSKGLNMNLNKRGAKRGADISLNREKPGLNHQSVVARLDNFGRSFGSNLRFLYGHIAKIEVDASIPELWNSLHHDIGYWSRLAVLIFGESGFRQLPYSSGYGIKHQNPALIRRKHRWSYYDVDNVLKVRRSKVPSWRASWSYPWPGEVPECQCSLAALANIKHDADSYRLLVQDNAGPDPWSYRDPMREMHKPWVNSTSSRSRDAIRQSAKPASLYTPKHPESYPIHLFSNSIWIEYTDHRYASSELDARLLFEQEVAEQLGFKSYTETQQCLKWVMLAAAAGRMEAMSIVRQLASTYHLAPNDTGKVQEEWDLSWTAEEVDDALRNLRQFCPDLGQLQRAIDRASLWLPSKHGFGSLSYSLHVQPYFDLSDPKSLLEPREEPFIMALYKSDSSFTYGSLLHMISYFGFEDAVQVLVDAGLDVNQTSSLDVHLTPLLCALRRGHHSIARLLITHGANCRPPKSWAKRAMFPPSPLHYLVYIEDDKAALELAALITARDGEVNNMCNTSCLPWSTFWPFHGFESVTPLRWAIMHGKAALAKELVRLGAKFGMNPFWPSLGKPGSARKFRPLLETPCTNIDILNLFFRTLEKDEFVLTSEFSQTPLGLLVSEDDTEKRRRRLGFGDPKVILAALDHLLTVQPGFEDIVLWSVIRHGHSQMLEHLVVSKGWDIERRWRGLTCLHTALLYGRVDIVKYLLSRGAHADSLTERRGLTCLHLLALVPRDPLVDADLMMHLSPRIISINAAERCSSLTALQLAIRNQKLHLVPPFLRLGADPCLQMQDQLELLSEGRSGCLQNSPSRPRNIVNDITVLGEVLLQYNQDEFYPLEFVEGLLETILTHSTKMPSADRARLLNIDSARTTTIIHMMAIIPLSEPLQLFELSLSCFPGISIDLGDLYGDSFMHYACLSCRPNNVKALIKLGAIVSKGNSFGITPEQAMVFSSVLLGPYILGFQRTGTGYSDDETTEIKH